MLFLWGVGSIVYNRTIAGGKNTGVRVSEPHWSRNMENLYGKKIQAKDRTLSQKKEKKL